MKFKRCLAVLACAAFLSAPVSAAETLTVRYRQDALFWQGSCEADYIKLMIAPRGTDVSALTDAEIGSRSDILITAVQAGEGGAFSASDVTLPGFLNGTYIAAVGSERRIFAKYDAAAATRVEGAFAASENRLLLLKENSEALGLDVAVLNRYGSDIVALLSYYMQHNDKGLSFSELYLLSEQVVLMQKGELSADSLFMLCHDMTDIDHAAHEKLPEAVLAALETTMPQQRYTDKSFAAAYRDALVLAQANSLGREMDPAVLQYLSETGFDMSQYQLLSDYEKNSVFGTLADAAPFADADRLRSAFSAAVKKQIDSRRSDSGGSSSGGGGGGGSDRPTYTVRDDAAEPTTKTEFADVGAHWAKAYIETMADRGVLNGFADGTFRPDTSVTRAEFVKMLTGLFGLSSSAAAQQFTDVAPDSWFYASVSAAVENGLVYGVSESAFAPNEQVTREDAAVILHRLFVQRGVALPQEGASFADDGDTAEYAKEAVLRLSACGVISGADGLFMPKRSLKRAEAAALLCRSLGTSCDIRTRFLK